MAVLGGTGGWWGGCWGCKVKEKTASCLFQFGASRWEVIFYSSWGGSSHLSAQMLNEYRSRPSCRLINTAAARGARPARLPRTAAAHRVPLRHRSRTHHRNSVLRARRRQLAPRRNKAAALSRSDAPLCCHLKSLLVLIDAIVATPPLAAASNRWKSSAYSSRWCPLKPPVDRRCLWLTGAVWSGDSSGESKGVKCIMNKIKHQRPEQSVK